ncbi:hypothetical protein GQS81_003556 [Salmonella enterica]|nr:hypothetical protein [Salmonella enterica]
MKMGYTDLTQHGFRSTFRDWAGETTNYPREVIEHALAKAYPLIYIILEKSIN